MRKFIHVVLLLLVITGIAGCSGNGQNNGDPRLRVVATTGMLADAVKNITGDKVQVESLMGPGVDPHLYKPSQSDLEKLSSADIIFYNGLSLEGKMEDILDKLGRGKKVVALGNQLDQSRVLKTAGSTSGDLGSDPHFWFDVSLWSEAVQVIASVMQERDSANAATYAANLKSYMAQLSETHQWVKAEIASIPSQQRMLITSHDAFGYFGRAYEIEVHGLQGVSTAADYGLQDVTKLVELIIERKVKAVFIESSVAQRSLQAVIEGCKNLGHEVKVGGTLFSDAMGETGSAEGTYLGMVKSNVSTIVSALK